MKKIKVLISALLVAAMLLSFAACHPANETAVTVGDLEVPAGVYLCALIQADGEGRNAVDAALAKAEEDAADDTASTTSTQATTATVEDYYAEEVDGTDFTAWVKNRALEIVKEYAAYTLLFNEKGLTLSDEEQSEIDSMADMYWNSYGYSQIYEPNGVSFNSYKEFFTYTYRTRAYFMSIYGEGGSKAIAEDELTKAVTDNFSVAKIMSISYSTTDEEGNTVELTEEEIKKAQERIKNYATRLEAGESFEKIYLEEYPESKSTETEKKEEEVDENASTNYTTPFVSEAGQPFCSSQYYSYEYFEEVKALEVGKTYTVDETEGGYSALMYKAQDALKYDDYREGFEEAAMYILKQEEFEAEIKTYIEGLEVTVNDYAVNRFKPKNIEYPEGAA